MFAWHLAEPRHPEKSNRTQAPPSTPANAAENAAKAVNAHNASAETADRRFTVGQRVYVWVRSARETGAGTIEATPEQLEGADRERFPGRYRVRFDEAYEDGAGRGQGHKRAHVRPGRLQAVLRPPLHGSHHQRPLLRPQAVVTHCTDEFRRQARAQLSCGRDARVLEVGCSTGECSAVIAQHAPAYASESGSEDEEEGEGAAATPTGGEKSGRRKKRRVWARGLVAVDLSAEALALARRRVPPPGARFLLADVLADPGALAERLLGRRWRGKEGRAGEEEEEEVAPGGSASRNGGGGGALFVDIGGKRAIADVVAAVDALTRAFSPELVVVKSEELAASAREWRRRRRRRRSGGGEGGEEEEEQDEEEVEGPWPGEGSPADAVPDSEAWWREAQQQQQRRDAGRRRKEEEEAAAVATTTTATTTTTAPAVVEVPPWYPRLVVRKRRAGLDVGGGGALPPVQGGCWLGVRPQRLPQRLVPGEAAGGRCICRFSNYGRCLRHEAWLEQRRRRGLLLREEGEEGRDGDDDQGQPDCDYDHDTCHACLARGHRAVDAACPVASAAYALAAAAASGGRVCD